MLSPEFLGVGGASSLYPIRQSLRLRGANSGRLTRTAGTPTNAQRFTISWWMRRGTLSTTVGLFSGFAVNSNFSAQFSAQSSNGSGDFFRIFNPFLGINIFHTDAVFRDTGSWYHFVFVYDSPNATANDRAILYVNGVRAAATVNVVQNATTRWNENGATCDVGFGRAGFADARDFFDGHIAEFISVDGQALTPSSFGRTDPATGAWVPRAYAGTFGAQGFYLPFNDATSTTTIAQDRSGNGNNFTASGISVTSGVTFDQSSDSPTLTHAAFSPLFVPSDVSSADTRWGNTEFGQAATNKNCTLIAPFEMRTGKWYWEITAGTILGLLFFGISRTDVVAFYRGGVNSHFYRSDGQKVIDGVNSAYGASFVAGDVIGVAYDADAGSITFYKNGVSQGALTLTGASSSGWFPAASLDNAGPGVTAFHSVNFGQRTFAYTPPTGFSPLHAGALPRPSILRASAHMESRLRTGTGATANVTGFGFQPDLVWTKSRGASADHALYDSSRGVQKQLESNNSGAETTETTGLTAFNADGFTIGALAQMNTNGATYVDTAWRKGTTPGFDIVTYTGNGVDGRQIAHGLGVRPSMYITKTRSPAPSVNDWNVWHSGAQSGDAQERQQLWLHTTNNRNAAGYPANANTLITSANFTPAVLNYDNVNGNTYVAYLFAQIDGFSRFGSYAGNSSADGPLIWCGFRPEFVLVKNITTGGFGWAMNDAARPGFNAMDHTLFADTAGAEGVVNGLNIDFVSTGFKHRASSGTMNSSGNTYVFAAFAETPFKYANAR